jgi:hypothetical protein
MTPTIINVPYKPRRWFWPYHHRQQRNSVTVGHRRCGKTFAHVNDLVRRVVECKHPDPRGSYIAPLYSQAKDIAWTYLKAACLPFADRGAKVFEAELMAVLPGNRQIRLYGADRGAGERLRGTYQDAVVVDEPEDISEWEQFLRFVLMPTLSDRDGYLSIIGTVKGRGNLYDAYVHALKDPAWYTANIKVTDTDVYTAAEQEELRASMGEAAFAQEYLNDWNIEGSRQFISGRDVAAAADITPYQTGDFVLGVDVARYGDDRTVLLTRNAASIDHIVIRKGIDLMQVSDLVVEEASRYKPVAIFVDGVGIGAGVVDYLRRVGLNVIEVQSGASPGDDVHFLNKRAEMWSRMKDWIKSGASLKLPAYQQEMESDLTCVEFEFDVRNRLKLESKESIKARRRGASPDLADALALTFFQTIAPKQFREKLAVSWAAPEASPFAEL